MTEPTNDDDLRTLLEDAVSDVHPEPALHRIRQRTDATPRAGSRTWLVGLAALATAAAITGVVVVTTQRGPDADSGPVASPSGSASPTAAEPAERALGIYYVGETPQGPRLFREFHRLRAGTGVTAVGVAVSQSVDRADDPDYLDPWPDGTSVGAPDLAGDSLAVSLANDEVDLSGRPAGMSAAEAEVAVQQLVYTAQAALQQRTSVRFVLNGRDARTLLGVDVSGPVSASPQLDVLALVSVTEPAEGVVVHDTFTAHGVASSFEATVPWEIRKGTTVVKRGFSTADGWMDKLYPWTTDPISVADLAEGTYTFAASTDDPSDGEGAGPTTDTRTIVVRH